MNFRGVEESCFFFLTCHWILLAFVAFVFTNALYVRYAYVRWQRFFAPRVARPHKFSLRRRNVQKRVMTICPAGEILNRMEGGEQEVPLLMKSSCPAHPEARDQALSMDHQYMDFIDFLWASYFISPNVICLALFGIIRLRVRELFQRAACRRLGVRNPAECVDFRRFAGRLVLEGTEILHFSGKFLKDGKQFAKFLWPDFPMLDKNGKMKIAKLLRVDIDLQTKCLEAATLDDEPLAARDVVILVWFHTISGHHVKIHAYANWAANPTNRTYDAFQHRMSVATVMYNFYGASSFPVMTSSLSKLGICTDFHHIREVFEKGMSNGVPNHADIKELMSHSELVKFIIPLRKYFHKTFEEHKAEFPGIDAESFFIGTIMHSLDHSIAAWNMKDPLVLDVEDCDPRFRVMAELGRFVRAGFVDDLPFLMFNKNYSNAPGEFYKQIYRYAARLNEKFADHMDCCIIK